MKRQRLKEGAIVKIPLQDGYHSYGRLLYNPYVEIFDYHTKEDVTNMDEIVSKPVLFTLSVYNDAITKGRWKIVGEKLYSPDKKIPLQFMQDITDPKECHLIDALGNMRRVSLKECRGYERAVVWEPEHIEERIEDHFAGRSNIWVETFKLKE
jgi:hypothetical protein